MTREEYCSKIDEAIDNFQLEGKLLDYKPYGNGHINDTFLVRCEGENQGIRYILQRMNHEIFKNPIELMENIEGVTGHLKKKILEENGDTKRETLNVIPTKDGKPLYQDSIGSYWRTFLFIEDTRSYDLVENAEDFYQTGLAFGRFQNLLADYPVEKLHETIPNFHHTPSRLEALKKAIKEDKMGRVSQVKDEIEFVMEREEFTHILEDLFHAGKLPLRVTHNDTKLNNIMIDNKSKEAICIIDLDTVMPGYSVNDFGDSIRFGASTGAEDEPDLSKVNFDLELYEAFTKGFIKGCNYRLTDLEYDLLPTGAKMMTLECGIRFLADYLQGDSYFKIQREKQNLDRCRTQFKLISQMEKKWERMKEIVDLYR